MPRHEPTEIESKIREYFAADERGFAAAYLFGSVARRTASLASDVDIAVLCREDPPSTLDGLPLAVEGELEQILERPVQIILLNSAAPDLVHRVLRDGILVLDRDPSCRIRFEVRSRNQYFDILPFLRRYRNPGAA